MFTILKYIFTISEKMLLSNLIILFNILTLYQFAHFLKLLNLKINLINLFYLIAFYQVTRKTKHFQLNHH